MSPSIIISSIPKAFDKALSQGDLFFFPSTTHVHRDEKLRIEFEIRTCPALQKKPTLPTPHFDPNITSQDELPPQDHNGGRSDPLAPPYVPNLHVGDLKDEYGNEYVVLLNKYSVIPHHFLLVTKEFKSQTSPLMPPELAQIYMLLVAARTANTPFFAFYNCGDHSGASQPHKHIQFIPIEGDGPPIERLARTVKLESADKPFSLTSLPYANHVFRLPQISTSTPPSELEQTLATIFLSLVDLVISTIRHDPTYPAGRPSYNVILTLEHMHLIPRKHETAPVRMGEADSETVERLSVNALGFAGMLLAKNEGELEAIKKEGVGSILRSVGLESVHDVQVAGTSLEAVDGDSVGVTFKF
jgi:ATP adenylyltransferase